MKGAHGRSGTANTDDLGLRGRRIRSLALLGIAWTITAIIGSSSCSSRTAAFPQDVTATKIVKQNAADAFVTHLGPSDLEALKTFQDRIAAARTRADLVAAWKSVPQLLAKGSTFLERQVFSRALEDGDWPSNQSPQQVEDAFAEGVKQATADFISRGGR